MFLICSNCRKGVKPNFSSSAGEGYTILPEAEELATTIHSPN